MSRPYQFCIDPADPELEGDALLIIYYDLALVDSVMRETMRLYRWDAGTEIWERERGGVTSIRDYMTVGSLVWARMRSWFARGPPPTSTHLSR